MADLSDHVVSVTAATFGIGQAFGLRVFHRTNA